MTSKDIVAAPGAGALSIADNVRMPPPPPRQKRKRKDVVLEEDDYTSKLEAIIERDYFPELGKLQDKVRWLEAVRSGDPEQVRAAQLAIAHRRMTSQQQQQQQQQHSCLGDIPNPNGHLFTPGGTAARVMAGATPSAMPFTSPAVGRYAELNTTAAAVAEGATGGGAGATPNVSLDTFLSKHTSEDNASFSEILESENKRRREKVAARLQGAHNRKLLITDGREKTDGFGTSGQSIDTLAGWDYKPMNLLMYDGSVQESKPFSTKEISEMVQGPPKQINSRNTRFKPTPLPGQATPSTSGDTESMHSRGGGGICGATDAQQQQQQQYGTFSGGYDILATPSFDPEVNASPFMTWGDIEATPMRIEAEDLPPGPLNQGGKSFKIHEAPPRETKAHALASKAAVSLRKRAALQGGRWSQSIAGTAAAAAVAAARGRANGGQFTPGGRSGAVGTTPNINSGSGGKTPLSAAARRLASGMNKKGHAGTDTALRASYNQTPVHRQRGSSVTPSHSHGSNWTPASDAR